MKNFGKKFIRFWKAIDWPLAFFSGFSGVLIGLIWADHSQKTILDSGWATLVGSALGAGITVAGGMWAAGYQAKAQTKAFDRFAGDAITAIRDEAHILVAVSEKRDFENRQVQGSAMLQTMSAIDEAVALFERNVASTKFANYDVQRWLNRLVNQLALDNNVMMRERAWLEGNITEPVIIAARQKLAIVGTDIRAACEAVTNELEYNKDLPDAGEVVRRIAKLIEVEEVDA